MKSGDLEMSETWAMIFEDYEAAKLALWCPKSCGHWSRDEDKGYYHMWKAYYAALTAEEKDHLLFARILMMMGDEQNYKQSDYTRLHRYYLPAKEQYQLAIETGSQPTGKELEHLRLYTDSLNYRFECENKPYDEQISFIEGHEVLSDFEFHDSKVICFSQDENSANMKLKYTKTLELRFQEVDDIEIRTDPICDWINEFYCYPTFYDKKKYIFDIGFYKIICSRIIVSNYK